MQDEQKPGMWNSPTVQDMLGEYIAIATMVVVVMIEPCLELCRLPRFCGEVFPLHLFVNSRFNSRTRQLLRQTHWILLRTILQSWRRHLFSTSSRRCRRPTPGGPQLLLKPPLMAFHMHPFPRATNSVVWPTGPLKEEIVNEAVASSTTATTEVGRSACEVINSC